MYPALILVLKKKFPEPNLSKLQFRAVFKCVLKNKS